MIVNFFETMGSTLTQAAAGPSHGPLTKLEAAVDDFRGILNDEQRRKLASIGSVRDAESVMIFTAQLDRENQLRKGRGVASRLHTILERVQAFTTVVDTYIQSNPEIAALVWGSLKFTLLVCHLAAFTRLESSC
jgi:hypothetical protein